MSSRCVIICHTRDPNYMSRLRLFRSRICALSPPPRLSDGTSQGAWAFESCIVRVLEIPNKIMCDSELRATVTLQGEGRHPENTKLTHAKLEHCLFTVLSRSIRRLVLHLVRIFRILLHTTAAPLIRPLQIVIFTEKRLRQCKTQPKTLSVRSQK